MDNPFSGLRAGATAGAVSVGLAAWRLGQDIHDAVTAAGYARDYAEYVVSYISQDPTGASEAADSMSPKRVKMTTTSSKRRSTIPVAPNVKKYVKGCMNRLLETKYYETSCNASNPGTSGAVAAAFFPLVQQGDNDLTREGNTIHVKAIRVRGSVSDTATGYLRIIWAIDHQPNGAAPAVGDLVANADINGGYNHNWVVGQGGSRFKIISDKRVFVTAPFSGGAVNNGYTFSWKGELPVRYQGNAGTVADMATNNLVQVVIAANATIDLTASLSFEYTDN